MIIGRQFNFDVWGYIPSFLSKDDPRPAAAQFDQHYITGYHHFDGFKLEPKTMTLRYPGDPPMRPLDAFQFRDETIFIYRSSWVLIMQKDKTWTISRMD